MARLRDGVIKRGATWSFVVRVADPVTGLTRPRWVGGFATEAAAKAARDEARQRARRGEYVDRSTITVGDFLDDWVASHALEVKPKTLAGYRWLVESYVKPRIGRLRLQALRPMDVSLMYRDLIDSGGRNARPLSRSTVDSVHRVLRKALNDAVRTDQLLESNPVVRAKRPRAVGVDLDDIWTPVELVCFLAFAQQHRLYGFLHLAAYTGARRGELLNLSWREVDLVAGFVRITGSAAVVDRRRVVGTTKGGRSRRVSIDPGTVRILQRHRAQQAEERLLADGCWPDSDLVFRTGLGKPIYPDTPSQLMPKLVAAYNREHPAEPLRPIRLHDLRHVHATTLLLAGEPVHVVANRLGHADPSITLRVYAHVIQAETGAVASTFARVMEGAVSKGVSTEGPEDVSRSDETDSG